MPIEFGSFSVGAVVGGVIVGTANHFLTKSRDKEYRAIKEFNEAGKNLRNAFTPELAALRSPASDNPPDPYNLLFGAFERHRIAVTEFRRFLKGRTQRDFDIAWQKYYSYNDTEDGEEPNSPEVKGEISFEYLIKYGPGWENIPEKVCRKRAVDNIENILKFAKHK